MSSGIQHPASGIWTYRSFRNNSDLQLDFNLLEFGRANLKLETDDTGAISGKIYDTGWELQLKGIFKNGTPSILTFQGSGTVGGSPWVYDYLAYLVPPIPNGKGQIPAIVGSVTRAISHPNGQGGTSPAGVVCSFFAVLQ